MKKYLLFAGHNYYPKGGIDDFHGSFKSIMEAKEWFYTNLRVINDNYIDHWGQIVERETLKCVLTMHTR